MNGVVTAAEALKRLQEGNNRFVSGLGTRDLALEHRRCRELATEQAPFAIVLGCSDSRVPAELVFDQGLGDLFVIRVAGNIVSPSQVGSIEFAADQFGTRLVVVLGHSQCGAIQASLAERDQPSGNRSPNLAFIVNSIMPVLDAVQPEPGESRQALLARAVRENIDKLRASGHPKWREVDLDAEVGIWELDSCSRVSPAAPPSKQGGRGG